MAVTDEEVDENTGHYTPMANERILSLVACDRNREINAMPDGNDSIRRTYEMLEAATPQALEKVSSLLDVYLTLKKRSGEVFDAIQIIGHATPGMLSLAHAWDESYSDKSGYAYVLDSNPYAHGVLAHSLEPFIASQPKLRVILAGCLVGSDEKTSYLARGSSLLYALHKMWGCSVFAAVDYISVANYKTGRFAGRVNGWGIDKNTGDYRYKKVGSAPAAAPAKEGAPPVRICDAKFVSAPVLGLLARPARVGAAMVGTEESLSDFTEVVELDDLPLALPELSFKGSLTDDKGGNRRDVDIKMLANGTLLSVHDKATGETVYVRRPASGAAQPQREIPRDEVYRAAYGDPSEPA